MFGTIKTTNIQNKTPKYHRKKKLQEKFAEDIANQGALMDGMGRQLLSLEYSTTHTK